MGFGKDGKGVIVAENRSVALGTLGGSTGILIGTNLAITDSFRTMKQEVSVIISGVTGDEAVGLGLYLIDGDLTLAEAEAAIEVNGPVDRSDIVANEVVMRPVFRVNAQFFMAGADLIGTGAVNTASLIAEMKTRWTFGATTGWDWMIYNRGAGLTTGATASLNAKNFGVWVGA